MNPNEAYEWYQINHLRAAVNTAPLAWDDAVAWAAEYHSQWLLDHDEFQHSDDLVAEINAGGFEWRAGSWGIFQNHQWSWGHVDVQDDGDWQRIIDIHLQNYVNSPDHYANLVDPRHEFGGVSSLVGNFRGLEGAVVNTQDSGWNARDPFVLGFVFDDVNGDGDYDIGEGRAGVNVTIRDLLTGEVEHTQTNAHGYYQAEVGDGVFDIYLGSDDVADATIDTDVANVLADFRDPGAIDTGVVAGAPKPVLIEELGTIDPLVPPLVDDPWAEWLQMQMENEFVV